MKTLLDTHTFIWWITDCPELSKKARDAISNRALNLYFSAASCWEIVVKESLGKIKLPQHDTLQFINHQLMVNSITPLPVQVNHACHTMNLPLHHRDPFDRLIIAQAQLEKMPIITADRIIADYDVQVIW